MEKYEENEEDGGEECTNEKNIFLKRDEKCVLVECMCYMN
jgi:hypothetical protein